MYLPVVGKRSKRLLELATHKIVNTKNKKIITPFHGLGSSTIPSMDNNDEDDDDTLPFKFPKLFGGNENTDIYTERNHIFFKTDVSCDSIKRLGIEIDNLNHKLATMQSKTTLGTFTPKPIYLHITTDGGDLLSGFLAYDKIKASTVPIYTVIEGGVASAGSVMSIAGSRRYMTPNSHLLIHQLRTGMFGTYEELIDGNANCKHFMNKLVELYHQNCGGKMSKTKIRDILKRDLFWDLETSIENGLVDEVWNGSITQ
jgi:ATP-dependent protease ClpP protease subunit